MFLFCLMYWLCFGGGGDGGYCEFGVGGVCVVVLFGYWWWKWCEWDDFDVDG